MKEGTYGIKLYFDVVDQDGEILPLDGALSVKLYVQQGTEVLEFECQIEDADEGLVSYTTKEDDGFTAKVGKEKMEVEVRFEGQLFVSENKMKEPVLKRIKQLT